MRVLPGRPPVGVEAGVGVAVPPELGGRTRGTDGGEPVVITDVAAAVGGRNCSVDDVAAVRGHDPVVGEQRIVRVVLHEELRGAVVELVVAAQVVVLEHVVPGGAGLDAAAVVGAVAVAAGGDAGEKAAGDDVVPNSDVVGASPRVLGRYLDADVVAADAVARDPDVRAAVDVDAVSAVAPPAVLPVRRIAAGADPVHVIAGDRAVARPVAPGVAVGPGQRPLEADGVDADVVVVVDAVADDRPVTDVAVDDHGFTRTEVQLVDDVRADRELVDRRVRVIAVHGDPVRVDVEAAQRGVVVAEVVHVVAEDPDQGVVPVDVDARRHDAEACRPVTGDPEPAHGDVAAVRDLDERGDSLGRAQAGTGEHRMLGAVRPQYDVADADQVDPLVVDAAAESDDTAVG